jgi:outer membrane protein TolC
MKNERFARLPKWRRMIAAAAIAALPAGAFAQNHLSSMPQASPEAPQFVVRDGAIQLSLEDTVSMALANNLSLVIERYGRAQAEHSIFANLGIYDLRLSADAGYADNQQATASSLEASAFKQQQLNLGLSQLFPSGGDLSFAFDNSRSETNLIFQSLNPSFHSDAGFQYVQPLLRDFGRQATERNIMVARVRSDISQRAFEELVANTIQDVENAYWNLVEARAQLGVSEESLTLAKQLHDQNRVRVDVGTLAPLELVQSEAGIATREEEIIRSQYAVGNAEDALRRLLNVPQGEDWSKSIVPTSSAEMEHVALDLEAGMQSAAERRPELERLRLAQKSAEIDAAFAGNQTKPRLDLTARYGLGGVGGDQRDENGQKINGGYGDALDQVTGADFPSWSVGLSFAFPLQNRTARENKLIADLEVQKAAATAQDVEQQLRTEVRIAARAVETAAKAIDSANVSVKLAEKNLDAEHKRYDNGMSTSFQLLQIQEDLTSARSRQVFAVTAYRRALVGYYRATGRLLEETGIVLDAPAAQD